jgi:putative ABC transport system permease protein
MIALLRLTHLPWWRRHPLQAALPVLGVALGVAAIVAVDLGSASTVSGFRATVQRLEGRATHQVLPARSAVHGELAWELSRVPGVVAAAPALEVLTLLLPAGEPLRLMGVDPFAEARVRALGLQQATSSVGEATLFRRFLAEPGALVVSAPLLRRAGLAAGDSLTLTVGARRQRAFVLAALPERVEGITVPDNLALCDVATAQELTGRADVTRLDLVLPERDRDRIVASVRAALPAGVELAVAGGRVARLTSMLAALRTNLAALSYLALFVSLFLIYNSMLLAVLRRRAQIGVVRCLGATRREVWLAWMAEAGMIAVLGTALGIGLGLAGGGAALRGVARTASDLYGFVRVDALALPPSTFVKAALAGLVAAVLAAAFPAAEAARTTPAHTAKRSLIEQGFARARRRVAVIALLLLVIAGVCLAWPGSGPGPGYAAAVALALAAAALAPGAAELILRGCAHLLRARGGVIAGLAVQNIRASMSRTGVALAALAVALSMSVAMGTMVGSFRRELQDWIADTVRADLYVSSATAELERLDAVLPSTLVDELRRHPEVRTIDTFRGRAAEVWAMDGAHGAAAAAAANDAGWACLTAGVEVDVYQTRARPRVLDGPPAELFLARLRAGEAGITETLMRRLGTRAGDRLRVRAGGRETEVTVAGVYRDYSSDRGVVLMDRGPWEAAFGSREPSSVALYLAAGADPDSVLQRLQRDLGGRWALLLRSNRALREEALRVFDRTFAVTRALELIGVAVAAIGIASALLAMLLERRRELAVLRALGTTQRQMDALLLSESGLLAGLAWLFSLGIGSALAGILLRWINVRSFGWSLPFQLPLAGWMQNLGFALLAAGLATLLPLARARRQPPAVGLHEE